VGTANIVAAAQAAGVQRLVFTSTMSVFDFMSPTLPLPLDEGDEVAPVNVYGEEKYAAELICQQAAERGDLAIPILRRRRLRSGESGWGGVQFPLSRTARRGNFDRRKSWRGPTLGGGRSAGHRACD
jgi:dTDP-4-dehydrorhamnose reductase